MLPLLVAVGLALGQVLAAGAARELAGHAAEAAAIALSRGADAREAGRAALPGWSRDRLDLEVHGRRVTATVRPLPFVPPLADHLQASVTADAGPSPPSPSGAASPAPPAPSGAASPAPSGAASRAPSGAAQRGAP